jgi:hypothetical protein
MLYITYFLLPFLAVLTALFLGAATYLTYQQMKGFKTKPHSSEQHLPNYSPFFYGNPVSPDKFIGRQVEVRRIAGRIVREGQSSAVTGTFRSGKTSILTYLSAPETQTMFYGDNAGNLIFSNLDAKILPVACDPVRFWSEVLEELQKHIVADAPNSSLSDAYQACQENHFANRELEELIAKIGNLNWQLVLMIDEFDVLLERPHLNNTEFLGGLRQLASRSKGALVLVMTINTSLTQFHHQTKQFTRAGSPFLNFLDEIVLGPLSDSEIDKLLHQGNPHFTDDDHSFIKEIAGGYPYLLQAAASALWESYEYGNEENPIKRQQHAKQEFYDRTKIALTNIWRLWTPTTRKAFTFVAIASSETLQTSLQIQPVDIKNRINHEHGFKQALEELEKQGFVTKEEEGWQVRPTIFLSFVADQPAQELQQLFFTD